MQGEKTWSDLREMRNEAQDLGRCFGGRYIWWFLLYPRFQVTWSPWCTYSSFVLPWFCPPQLFLVVHDCPGTALYPYLFTAVSTPLGSRTLIVTESVVAASLSACCHLRLCVCHLSSHKRSPCSVVLHFVCSSWEKFLWFSVQIFESVLLGSQSNLCTSMQ